MVVRSSRWGYLIWINSKSEARNRVGHLPGCRGCRPQWMRRRRESSVRAPWAGFATKTISQGAPLPTEQSKITIVHWIGCSLNLSISYYCSLGGQYHKKPGFLPPTPLHLQRKSARPVQTLWSRTKWQSKKAKHKTVSRSLWIVFWIRWWWLETAQSISKYKTSLVRCGWHNPLVPIYTKLNKQKGKRRVSTTHVGVPKCSRANNENQERGASEKDWEYCETERKEIETVWFWVSCVVPFIHNFPSKAQITVPLLPVNQYWMWPISEWALSQGTLGEIPSAGCTKILNEGLSMLDRLRLRFSSIKLKLFTLSTWELSPLCNNLWKQLQINPHIWYWICHALSRSWAPWATLLSEKSLVNDVIKNLSRLVAFTSFDVRSFAQSWAEQINRSTGCMRDVWK